MTQTPQILEVGTWLKCSKCGHEKIGHYKTNGLYFCNRCDCFYEVARRTVCEVALYQMEAA